MISGCNPGGYHPVGSTHKSLPTLEGRKVSIHALYCFSWLKFPNCPKDFKNITKNQHGNANGFYLLIKEAAGNMLYNTQIPPVDDILL